MFIGILAKIGNPKIVVYLTYGVCDKIVGVERHSVQRKEWRNGLDDCKNALGYAQAVEIIQTPTRNRIIECRVQLHMYYTSRIYVY